MVRLTAYVFWVFGVLLPVFKAKAQEYNFKHYTTKNGLPNPFVNHIFCDSKGFLWISTQGGLSKFDGSGFTNFTSREGLPGSDVLCSTQDENGAIWVGTNGFGVAKYQKGKFTIYNTKNGLCDNHVYGILQDSKHNLWFITQGGLSKMRDGKMISYTIKDGLPTNLFFAGCEDKNGNLWFGCKDAGVIKYNGKSFERISKKDPLYALSVFSMYYDAKGTIWVGTPGDGLWHSSANGFKRFEDERINHEFISAIREDIHHNVWVATDNQLVKINGSRRQYFTIENGLTSNTIYSLGFDHDGRLWAGTINGLNVFVNEAFINYNEKNGISNNNITVFCRDVDGELLIGTAGGGLNLYDGETIRPIDISVLNNANILSITKTIAGEIIVGLNNSDAGLIILEKKNGQYRLKQQIKTFNGTDFSTVTGLIQTLHNELYISTYGKGLWKYHDKVFTQVLADSAFNVKDIMTMFMDSKHNLWISLNQNGVVKYDFKKYIHYTTKNGLGDNTVMSICEDRNNNIVFGNYENGITAYDGKTFKTFNKSDNLCSDNVQAVICDRNNFLWVGTNNGLNKIKLSDDLKIISVKLYNETNGLLGTEINQNAIFADKNNTLWIGSNQGLTRYHSLYDYKNTTPPNMVFTNLKLNYSTPNWKNFGFAIDEDTRLPVEPHFSHSDNHLTFYFQALTIDRVEFSYMLEGFDQRWTPLSTKSEADYTNIPPGEYTFKVKAINSDGVWNKDELTYSFIINPPFWQTWWFRITVVVLLIVIVIAIFKWRTAQLAREKKILEEKVTERTHELSVANSQLSVALHDIKDSIFYAQKIQQSILPDEETFTQMLEDAFLLFMPKDIVSGDFYWIGKNEKTILYATCDCTGHGVPGGFMTMLGTSFLNETVNEHKIKAPAEALNIIREKIIDALKQTGVEGENKDGMDMVLCAIDKENFTLHYAAANNGFYVVRKGELIELKADKQPIGYFSHQTPFTQGFFQLQKGDVIYTFTDGYADQFGGPKGKKFKYKQLEEILVQIYALPMREQKAKLQEAIHNWMAEYEQVDDILLIGYRV